MANSRALEFVMGGVGCGATLRGSSWGLVPRGQSDPDPSGDENTRIGAAPAAPENINITTIQQLPATRFFDLLFSFAIKYPDVFFLLKETFSSGNAGRLVGTDVFTVRGRELIFWVTVLGLARG